MNINAAKTQYASAGSDEQKNHMAKEAYFDCSQREHLHKNYSINSYSKIQTSTTTPMTTLLNTNP
jgi:hypothetical protein